MAKKDRKAEREAQRRQTRQNAKDTAGSKGGNMLINLPDGIGMYTAKIGKQKLDFIQYEVTHSKHPDGIAPGQMWWKMPYKMHWLNEKPYVCPKTFGLKCPLCEYYSQLKKDGNEEEAKLCKQKEKVLYLVIPRGIKGVEETMLLWDISFWNFQDMLNDRLEDAPDDWLDFRFPDDGKTMKVKFKEKQLFATKFPQASQIDFIDRDDLTDDDQEDAFSLDKAVAAKMLTYAQLEAIIYSDGAEELAEEEDDEHCDNENLIKNRKKKDSKKKTEPELSDEPDVEDMDEDELKEFATSLGASKREIKGCDDEDDLRELIAELQEPAKEEDPKDEKRGEAKKMPPAGMQFCVACGGSGENSRGNKCKPCNGTGFLPKKEEKEVFDKCPHGHTFGEDCDKFPKDCDDCKLWEKCDEAQE